MPDWEEQYARGGGLPPEPHPWLLHAVEAFQREGAARVLDLGCGRGRHLAVLATAGHDAWGSDVAPTGLRLARAELLLRALPARLVLSEMTASPFAAGSFDAVAAIHVLYHGRRHDVESALAEARRVLRPGGLLAATFLSDRTWKFGEGPSLETNTYVQARGAEAGVVHHYCDEPGVRSLLAAYNLLALEFDDYRDEQGLRHCHWLALARRV